MKGGLTELSVAIRGAEDKKQIIVYRAIVAMLLLSRRLGVTETYILCPSQLCVSTFVYQFRYREADSGHGVWDF